MTVVPSLLTLDLAEEQVVVARLSSLAALGLLQEAFQPSVTLISEVTKSFVKNISQVTASVVLLDLICPDVSATSM